MEMAEDNKDSAAEVTASLANAINPAASMPELSLGADMGGLDLSGMTGGFVDISV